MAKKNQLTKSDYLPMSEFKKLLKELHKDKKYIWELYARLSFCTALRCSDVLSLTWHDIWNRCSLTVTEKKTGKTRKIPFNLQTQERIDEAYLLMKRPNPNELIFYNKKTRKTFTIQYINQMAKRWKEKYDLNIDHFSTHTFRKTFGRYVYDTSKDKSEALILVNSILNHSTIDVTKVYIGLRQDEVNSVFNSINL
nr:MAG: integrase family protein [Bacteriophage sp.]